MIDVAARMLAMAAKPTFAQFVALANLFVATDYVTNDC